MLEFIAPLPAQLRILTSLDHPCGLSPPAIWGLSQVFKNDLVFEGCKGCLEECPEWPSNTERPGRRMVRSWFFSRFFNEHLTGVVSLGPTGENKTGMRSSRMKSLKEEHKYWLGRTNLEHQWASVEVAPTGCWCPQQITAMMMFHGSTTHQSTFHPCWRSLDPW